MVGHALVSILHTVDRPQDKVACWIVREGAQRRPRFWATSWGLPIERNTVISTAVHGRVFDRLFLLWVSKGYEALDGYIYETYKAYKSRPIEGFTGIMRVFMFSAAILAQISLFSSGWTSWVFSGTFQRRPRMSSF